MKRLLLWTFIILLVFSGCSVPQNGMASFTMERVVTGAEPMDVASDVDSAAYSQWTESVTSEVPLTKRSILPYESLVSVSLDWYQLQNTAEDGTLLFTNQARVPRVYAEFSSDVTGMVNNQLEAYRQKKWGEVVQWEEEASAYYEEIEGTDYLENFYGWSSYTSVLPQRVDGNYISLIFYNSAYTGGAHPNNVQSALNFDAATGGLLSLASIFKAEKKQAVLDILLDYLGTMEDTFGLFEGYEDTVKSQFENMSVDMGQNWYLTERGIVFFFSPYEISPYAAGVVTVELPYQELQDLLQDDFILPIHISEGSSPVFLLDAEQSGYTNVEEITITDGIKLALTAGDSGTVYNLRVYQAVASEGQLVNQSLLYAANRLTKNDLLVLDVDASRDGQSVIGVSYTVNTDEADMVEYIMLSGDQIIVIDN